MPYTKSLDYIPFIPIIDGFMLDENPSNKRHYANEIEVMLGWTSREALNNVIAELASFIGHSPKDVNLETYRRTTYRYILHEFTFLDAFSHL